MDDEYHHKEDSSGMMSITTGSQGGYIHKEDPQGMVSITTGSQGGSISITIGSQGGSTRDDQYHHWFTRRIIIHCQHLRAGNADVW